MQYSSKQLVMIAQIPKFTVRRRKFNMEIEPDYQSVPYCPFCDLHRPKIEYAFVNAIPRSILKYSRKILLENDFFYVIPDISPISEYHLLIVTKQHYLSMNGIPKEMGNSLKSIKKEIEKYIKKVTHHRVIYFEHGTCLEVESACIAHAHLHCLPLSEKDITRLFEQIMDLKDDTDVPEINENYMFMQLKKGFSFTWADNFRIKQFLRKMIAETLKVPNRTNWQQSLTLDHERLVSESWLKKTVSVFEI